MKIEFSKDDLYEIYLMNSDLTDSLYYISASFIDTLPNNPKVFTVAGHGDSDSLIHDERFEYKSNIRLTPKEFVDIIKDMPSFKEAEIIHLGVCQSAFEKENGRVNSFAQEVANLTGKPTIGYTGYYEYHPIFQFLNRPAKGSEEKIFYPQNDKNNK